MKLLFAILKDQRGGTLAITRKTANTLITAAGFNTNYGEIEAVVNGDIDATNLEDAAVTAAKLGTAAVETAKIKDANVTADKLASDAVTTVKILDANVTTAKIADANVTTAKIADSNVTTAKIADANVTTAKIADSNVTIGKINFDHDDLGGLTDNDHPQYARGQSTNYKIDSGTTGALGYTTSIAVSFNFTFAAAPKVVVSTNAIDPGNHSSYWVTNVTTTGFTLNSGTNESTTYDWIAVGTAA